MKRSPQHVTGGYLGSSYPEGNADRTSLCRGSAKWLKVWQNRRRRRDDRNALSMASRSRRRRDRYELKRIVFLTLLDAQRGIIRCDLEWNIYPWGKIAKKAIFPQAKVTKKAMLKPCNNQTKPQPYPTLPQCHKIFTPGPLPKKALPHPFWY